MIEKLVDGQDVFPFQLNRVEKIWVFFSPECQITSQQRPNIGLKPNSQSNRGNTVFNDSDSSLWQSRANFFSKTELNRG